MGKQKTNRDVLTLEGVFKNFGSLEILKNVNLSLSAGESLAILGPSGSGKSTLLHISGLMDRPTAGMIFLDENKTTGMTEKELAMLRLNKIGFLFQFHHLLPDFDLLENVLMPTVLAGDDKVKSREKALDLLHRMGLKERLRHKPYELSGGEQQRAALARALVRTPSLLLCDEPTGNLDQETAQDVAQLIWTETKNHHIATIVVTHNAQLAKTADRSLHLSKGNFLA